MTPIRQSPNTWLALTTIAACTVLTVVLLATLPQPAQALPPRPTVPPAPGEGSPAAGAQIQLQAQFPKNWPWQTAHWQELWTQVQWQDALGAWHDVEGWQGTLDEVQDGTGKKTWWVTGSDEGKGPFRWRVYRSKGGWLFTTSEQFYLPAAVGETVRVELSLTP